MLELIITVFNAANPVNDKDEGGSHISLERAVDTLLPYSFYSTCVNELQDIWRGILNIGGIMIRIGVFDVSEGIVVLSLTSYHIGPCTELNSVDELAEHE